MTNATLATLTQVPPELLRSTPRPVKLSAAGMLVAGIVLLCCVGIVADLVGTLGQVRLRNTARQDGVAATGEVIGVTVFHGKNAREVVRYRYQAADAWREGRASLPGHRRPTFAAGDKIQIAFLPSDPDVSWMPGHAPGLPLWFVPIIPTCLVIAVIFLVRELRQQAYMLSNGRAALGRVTESRRVYKRDHRAYRIDYEFTILSGARRSGRYEIVKNPPTTGAPLIILYDPDQPRRSRRYPLSLVRLDI